MNNQNDNGKWWSLSGPLETIAAALQSLVAVTSSTRNFVSGCFHCGTDFTGCFKRRENTSDGAWFDCDQLQADHPYCYENQIAIQFGDDDVITSSQSLSRSVNHVSRECNGIFATTSPPSKRSSSPQALRNIKEECKSDLPNTSNTPTTFITSSTSSNACDKFVGEISSLEVSNKPKKVSNYKKYEHGLLDSTSFASKLEQDHFGQRNDHLRSEGEVLTSKCHQRSNSERGHYRPSIKSPILERRKTQSLDLDNEDWDKDIASSSLEEDKNGFFGDIWKPNELEDVFEVYNSSTLQSYGYMSSVQQKKSSTNFKGSTDKFEDIFPPLLTLLDNHISPEQNNNDKDFIKVKDHKNNKSTHDIATDNSLVTQIHILEKDQCEENKQYYRLTKQNLKKLIEICINVDSVDEFDLVISHLLNEKFCCDKQFLYCGKSFNRTLLFNLVKEAKKEYLNQYSNSLLLCHKYPTSIIENKVICALEFSNNCQPYQVALLEDVEKIRQRMLMYSNLSEFAKVPDEILIENVTAHEVRKEGRLWQNVEMEEREIQAKISEQIFSDFISSEITFLEELLSKKQCDKE